MEWQCEVSVERKMDGFTQVINMPTIVIPREAGITKRDDARDVVVRMVDPFRVADTVTTRVWERRS